MLISNFNNKIQNLHQFNAAVLNLIENQRLFRQTRNSMYHNVALSVERDLRSIFSINQLPKVSHPETLILDFETSHRNPVRDEQTKQDYFSVQING